MLTKEEKNKLIEQGERECDKAIQTAEKGDQILAFKQFDKAESIFEELQDIKWLNFLRHEKFRILQEFDNQKQALELSELIINGYLETANRRGLSLILIHRAVMLLEMGENWDALKDLRTAHSVIIPEKLDDLSGYLYSSLATVLIALEDYSAAIQSLDSALQHYPEEFFPVEFAWCLLQQGICYKTLYAHKSAEKYLQGAYQAFLKTGDHENRNLAAEQLKNLKVDVQADV